MERDLPRDGCVGVSLERNSLERKDAHLEQELQRKRQKRVRIVIQDDKKSPRSTKDKRTKKGSMLIRTH